jgi:hypothetical protein
VVTRLSADIEIEIEIEIELRHRPFRLPPAEIALKCGRHNNTTGQYR